MALPTSAELKALSGVWFDPALAFVLVGHAFRVLASERWFSVVPPSAYRPMPANESLDHRMLEVSDTDCYDINDSHDSNTYVDLSSQSGFADSFDIARLIPLTTRFVANQGGRDRNIQAVPLASHGDSKPGNLIFFRRFGS